MQGFRIDKQNKIDRKTQRNYKKTFSENLNRLILLMKALIMKEDIMEWSLFSGDLNEDLFWSCMIIYRMKKILIL